MSLKVLGGWGGEFFHLSHLEFKSSTCKSLSLVRARKLDGHYALCAATDALLVGVLGLRNKLLSPGAASLLGHPVFTS